MHFHCHPIPTSAKDKPMNHDIATLRPFVPDTEGLRNLWAAVSEAQGPCAFRDMERATGIRGRRTLQRLLRRLELAGYVRHNPRVHGYSWTVVVPLLTRRTP